MCGRLNPSTPWGAIAPGSRATKGERWGPRDCPAPSCRPTTELPPCGGAPFSLLSLFVLISPLVFSVSSAGTAGRLREACPCPPSASAAAPLPQPCPTPAAAQPSVGPVPGTRPTIPAEHALSGAVPHIRGLPPPSFLSFPPTGAHLDLTCEPPSSPPFFLLFSSFSDPGTSSESPGDRGATYLPDRPVPRKGLRAAR